MTTRVIQTLLVGSLFVPFSGAQDDAWSGIDMGRVRLAGSHLIADGVFTLRGADGGLFVAGDGFHFVYRRVRGDFDLRVRALSLKSGTANSILGLIARKSLRDDAKDVYLFLRPNRGYIAACPARTGEDVESVQTVSKDTGVTLPRWLRLVRKGSVFETFLSEDGQNWKAFGSVTNAMADHLYVGFYVSSHRTALLTEAAFDQVALRGDTPPPAEFSAAVATTLKRSAGDLPRSAAGDL